MMNVVKEFATALWEMTWDWPLGTVLAILTYATGLFVAAFVLFGLFYAADSWFLPSEVGCGYVIEKKFTAAHTTYVWINGMPYPQRHSDDWSVRVRVGASEDSLSVSEWFYNQLSLNDPIDVRFTRGRMSRGIYVKELTRV